MPGPYKNKNAVLQNNFADHQVDPACVIKAWVREGERVTLVWIGKLLYE